MSKRISRQALDNFGARVRNLRLKRGLSQEELANIAGVHRTYIGMIERGEKNPTLISMGRIASALEEDISVLVKDVFDGE